MNTDSQQFGVFHPGEFIREEMEARGWSQSDLAEVIGRSAKLVSEILSGKRGITPETAKGLGDAFGTGAQVWLNLESKYRLSLLANGQGDAVARRARIYEIAPVKEMIRRGWIEGSDTIDLLEEQIKSFLQLQSIADEPALLAAGRAKGSDSRRWSASQLAWMFRVRQLGSAVGAERFTPARLEKAVEAMRGFIADAENVRRVPRTLAAAGVRFLVVEHTAGSRIDGATMWLDEKSPVIALSLRFDRLDYFWHTLLHEVGHVRQGPSAEGLDVDLAGPGSSREDWSKSEVAAEEFAKSTCVPQRELLDFIGRVRPIYSEKRIKAFAARHGIHPSLVLGQLQYRGEVPWKNLTRLHAKVRGIVTEAAVCDGWGYAAPAPSCPRRRSCSRSLGGSSWP